MMGLSLSDPFILVFVLISLSLAPFLAVMTTSFVKIVVVLSLIRNALGVQQIPPNMVINGLAIILSIYVMSPVIQESYGIIAKQVQSSQDVEKMSVNTLKNIAETGLEPFREFLLKHSNEAQRYFFLETTRLIWPKEHSSTASVDNFMILIPSFTVSELTTAFQIGFILYLPFITIDLIIANILLAMGMMMVSPMTISLPFKLMIFVLVNGWTFLVQGLVLTYR